MSDWCTTGSQDGLYHSGQGLGYIFNTKCGEIIPLMDLQWRALKNEDINKCENCIYQGFLEELAE
jgi:hypothetical protein